MDTIRGLHAANAVTSFSPQRTGSTKFKGKPDFKKLKKLGFGQKRAGKKVSRTSRIHCTSLVQCGVVDSIF